MIKCVQQKGLRYKYYVLLSGQDYLIKPIAAINEELDKNYPKPYIDCTPYDKSNWMYQKFNELQMPRLQKLDCFITEHISKWNPLRKILRLSVVITRKYFPTTLYDNLAKMNISIYGGSAWWILPDTAIDFIYDLYNKESQLSWISLLLSSRTPEETFFQTLTMMSSVKELVETNPISQREQNCKTWSYFEDTDKPFVYHPYVFTTKEFEKLKTSDCFFARKFDTQIDAQIIRLIEENLL